MDMSGEVFFNSKISQCSATTKQNKLDSVNVSFIKTATTITKRKNT